MTRGTETTPGTGPGTAVGNGGAPGTGSPAVYRPGVAAFDFDGTLARCDTLVPFLRRVCGNHRVALASAAAARTSRNRDELKLAALSILFRGWPETRLAALGEAYAATLPELLRPELVERVRWHQAEGHAVVIVSASLGTYLRPLAERLGIDAALAVELVAGTDGRLTGDVVGSANTRGRGKVERLRTWVHGAFGPATPVELWAYGDSSGDVELLAAADHPMWVGRRATRNGGRSRLRP